MRALLPLFLVGLVACDEETDKDTDTMEDTADTMADDTGPDTDTPAVAYSVTANVANAATGVPLGKAAAGLCGQLLDPTSIALGGEDFDVVTTAVVGKDGGITFEGVEIKPALGMLINIDDCDDATDDRVAISTNTGLLASSYENAKAGDVVPGLSFIVDAAFLGGLQGSLAAVGDKTDLTTAGFFYGFTFDSAQMPVAGVTVECPTCTNGPTYYVDTDPADGLLSTAGKANAATQAGVGVYMVPGGEIGSYNATDTNGVVTFEPQLNGSAPGSAVITAFFGN